MHRIRMMWGLLAAGGVLGTGFAGAMAAPPEPIQAGQRVFTLSPAPLQVSTETQAVVGPGVEVLAERVQGEWIWVTVRGWVRSSLVQAPAGGLLQSGQTLVTRSEAPLQVESETRAVVLPGRKLSFEQAQGDWLWVAVEGWCQAGYLAKEPPAFGQAVPPAADSGWQYQQVPGRAYYYYYDFSPYGYRSYPSYRYYYYWYWPDYYRYGPRPWIDIDIDIYRYWPPDRYRPPYYRPDRPGDRPGGPSDRPPDWRRPPYPKPDGPSPHHPPGKPDVGPTPPSKWAPGLKPPINTEPGPKSPIKLEPAPKAPAKTTPGPKTPKVGPPLPKASVHQSTLPPSDREDRPAIKTPPSFRQDRPAIKSPVEKERSEASDRTRGNPSASPGPGRAKESRKSS